MSATCTAAPAALTEDTSALVTAYIPLVRRAVQSVSRKLPNHVELDDLFSVGAMGLVQAAHRYDPEQGHTFEAYALTRIRGAILDELRRLDTMPRTTRAKVRRLQSAVHGLEQRLGRAPSDDELRAELSLSQREFSRLQRQTRPINVFSLDAPAANDESATAGLHESVADEEQLPGFIDAEQNELTALLVENLQHLPQRQQRVLAMLFYEDMRLSEVAQIFGITEARVCQIRTQAVNNLRKLMASRLD